MLGPGRCWTAGNGGNGRRGHIPGANDGARADRSRLYAGAICIANCIPLLATLLTSHPYAVRQPHPSPLLFSHLLPYCPPHPCALPPSYCCALSQSHSSALTPPQPCTLANTHSQSHSRALTPPPPPPHPP
eukprot:Hpha_TRINITY_DN26534_c0_g1::TRINITY_DN26534_c0_g1_i1::g.112961::m.112961